METRIFGTEARKLVRHDSPDTSHAAAEAVDTTRLESMVYEAIRSFGDAGCISDDVLAKFPTFPYSSITARYRSLLDKGYIKDTGHRRPGRSGKQQRILQAVVN